MVKDLWRRVNRPNVMIKIPGTKEGIPAIEESIYRGYSINVTLIFSVEMYERAARAYVKGLQRRFDEGNSSGGSAGGAQELAPRQRSGGTGVSPVEVVASLDVAHQSGTSL